MSLVVTGISQTSDISVLHKALEAAGLPTAALQVIGPDDSTGSVARGIAGAELISGSGGTGVPGLGGGHRVRAFFRNESASDRLGDLEIPDSEVDNYVEALERGKTIVGYFAHKDTLDRAAQIFRDASLVNVRIF